MDKGNCFCGKKAIGGIGIPLIQLTESQKVIDLEDFQSSVIVFLCPYHSVYAEKGFLKTDGKSILKPEPFLEFEGHTNEYLLKYLIDNKGKKGIGIKRFIINIILEARHREKVYPEYIKSIKGKTDILEMMQITKKMFETPNYASDKETVKEK